jgi:Zn-dependent peptidase ImmA (M78 family)
MVHVWLGKPGLFNLEKFDVAEDDNERYCNKVAAEFLIPKEKFSDYWERTGSVQERCAAIAKAFKVSPLVAGRRALELEYISSTTFYKFYREVMENWRELKQKNKDKPAPVFWQQQHLRLGDRFGYAVAQAYAERRLLPSEAQDLTGFSRETFSRYAQSMIRRKTIVI